MTLEEATQKAKVWAEAHRTTSIYAESALAYINAIDENRDMGFQQGIPEVEADKTQYAYILCNLGPWRGEEAREAKKVIREFIK